MATTNQQAIATLNRLARMCKASEKGFNVAAENVHNRGLKVMFKTYAQERAQYTRDLQERVQELGGEPASGGGPLAAWHRGWINIKSAMTIGEPSTERVVLAEACRGEGVAVRTYEKALQGDLPAGVRELVERQHERIKAVSERVEEMRGRKGARLVVRLFDRAEDADQAKSDLVESGFQEETINRVGLDEVLTVYDAESRSSTTTESAFAGAILGAGAGVLLGLVAGISALVAPGGPLFDMGMGQTFVTTIVLGAVVVAVFGALLGAIIGLGVSQEDQYRYAESMERGHVLLLVRADTARATEASSIMQQVNARRRGTMAAAQ